MKGDNPFSRFERSLRDQEMDVALIEGRTKPSDLVANRPKPKMGRPPKAHQPDEEKPARGVAQVVLPAELLPQLELVAGVFSTSRANLLRMLTAAALEAVVDHLDMNAGIIRFPLSLRVTAPPVLKYNPIRRLSADQFQELKGFRISKH